MTDTNHEPADVLAEAIVQHLVRIGLLKHIDTVETIQIAAMIREQYAGVVEERDSAERALKKLAPTPTEADMLMEHAGTIEQLRTDNAAKDEKIAALDRIISVTPHTKDGVPIVTGMTYFTSNPDRDFFGDSDIVDVVVDSITHGLAFPDYKGTHTISGEDIECGNLELFSSAAALADTVAKEGK